MITATIKQCRLVTIKYMPIHNDCKCNVQESAKRLRDTSQVAGTFKIKNLNQDPDTRCWILKCARPRLRTIITSRTISVLETFRAKHCSRPLLRAPSHNRPKFYKAIIYMCVENIIFNLLATLPQSHAERMFHIRRPRGWVKISCYSLCWDIYM